MDEIKVALFGVGGYAVNYLKAMEKPARPGVRLIAAVDPYVKECSACPVYATAEEMYANHQPDLVVIVSPIHLHAEQAIMAFEHGCHVALEKPIAPTMQEVRDILAARDRSGKLLSIGYQFCTGKMMQEVKADFKAGKFGQLKRMRAIVLWPRDNSYYRPGGGWKGRKYDDEGRPIFDCVLSNATSHYLMNMLYLTETPLRDIECAAFKAYDIETFDTAVVRGVVGDDTQIMMAVSHACAQDKLQNPMWRYEFEHATLDFGSVGSQMGEYAVVRFNDGRVKEYGKDAGDERIVCLWNMVDAIRGDAPIYCTGENAALHTQTMERIFAMVPEATPFPQKWLRQDGTYTYVPGLAEALFHCYEQGSMPRWNLQAAELTEES